MHPHSKATVLLQQFIAICLCVIGAQNNNNTMVCPAAVEGLKWWMLSACVCLEGIKNNSCRRTQQKNPQSCDTLSCYTDLSINPSFLTVS